MNQTVTPTAPASEPSAPQPPPAGESSIGSRATELLGRYGIPLLLLLLLAFFSIAEPESFASWRNYKSILTNQTVVVILALAAMIPLIVGEFDLSVAPVLGLSQMLTVGLTAQQGLPPWLAIVLSLLACAVCGLVNGLAVVVFSVPAFVATLAIGNIVGGLVLWYSAGQTIFQNVPASLTDLARTEVAGIPLPVIYAAVISVGLWVLLSQTAGGRRMYATGGNRAAAELTGIRSRAYVMGAFVASAVLAGIGGAVLGARLGSASPSAGASLLLPAFAGAFLGATTIKPGKYNVVGTVISVYALSVAISGLQQMGAPTWLEPVFNGAALVIAVALSAAALRSRARRARAQQLERILAARSESSSTPSAT